MNQVPHPRPASTPPQASDNASPGVAVDTGPLLCFGLVGPSLLIDRYRGRLLWAKAVSEEIGNIARTAARRPGNPKVGALQAEAARKWDRARTHLGEPQTVSDRSKVNTMRTLVQDAARREATPGRDLGESETLVLAQQHNSNVLINEIPATKVARQLSIPTHCALDLLITLCQEGQIELRTLQKHYEKLRQAEIDPGGTLPSPCRAKTLAKWNNLAPR
ncbi:hypothetical protein ACGFNU_05640 [Spirillospora sp. NPDC048911]|uniref:hypothetical protein n=1 Tax=Spirillospora sp. NPDC048911 TaxID=3364527 RepID=UPI00371E600D